MCFYEMHKLLSLKQLEIQNWQQIALKSSQIFLRKSLNPKQKVVLFNKNSILP